MIEEEAFAHCENLKQVIFDPGSAVTEIQYNAFYCSGLESFTAPSSLRKIDTMAFQNCWKLKKFELNEGIRDPGLFCLYRTGITDLYVPPHVKLTREQLGLD